MQNCRKFFSSSAVLLSVRLHNLQLTHQLKPQKRLYTLGLRKRQLLVIKDDVIRDYLCFKGITRLILIIYRLLDATASLKPVAPMKKRYSVINLNQQHIGAVRLSSCRSFFYVSSVVMSFSRDTETERPCYVWPMMCFSLMPHQILVLNLELIYMCARQKTAVRKDQNSVHQTAFFNFSASQYN